MKIDKVFKAKCLPGQILQVARIRMLLIVEGGSNANSPPPKTKCYSRRVEYGRIDLTVCSNEPIRPELIWIRIIFRIAKDCPTLRVD